MRRHTVAIVLLIVLAIVDAVLVFATVRSTHVNATALTPAAPGPAGSAGTTTSPAGSESSQRSTTSSGRIIITALTDLRAWRAVTSSTTCHPGATSATIGHSDDGGQTWTQVTVPMATVSGLSAVGKDMIATGLDTSCQPVSYALSSSSNPRKVTTSPPWTVDPGSPKSLLAAGAKVSTEPCSTDIADVAVNSASDVVVLCAVGSVRHSTDTGASWTRMAGPSHVVAIATAGNDNKVYTAARAGCGITVAPLSGGGSGSCVAATMNWTGPIDMTAVGQTMWLGTTDATITEQVGSLG